MTAAAASGEDGPWCWGRCGGERVAAATVEEEGPWCWGRFGSERMAAVAGEEEPLAFLLAQCKEASDNSVLAFLEQDVQRILLEQPKVEEEAKCTDAPPADRQLSPNLVNFVLSLKREVPTSDHLDELTDIFPPEWIEKRRQEHKKRVALYNKIDDDMELFQARLRKELKDNGYVKAKKVDDDWLASFAKVEAWAEEQFAKSERIEYNDSDFDD